MGYGIKIFSQPSAMTSPDRPEEAEFLVQNTYNELVSEFQPGKVNTYKFYYRDM